MRGDPWLLVFYEGACGGYRWEIVSTPRLKRAMSMQILAIYELPDEFTTLGDDTLKRMALNGTLRRLEVTHG